MNAKMKILRDGEVVGELIASAQLVSEDAELNTLWSRWQRDGFRVLGPASGPVREGRAVRGGALDDSPRR